MRVTIDPQKDYYSILGVEDEADIEEIKTAFRTLARRYHPDNEGGDAERFRRVQEALRCAARSCPEAATSASGRRWD